MADKRKNLFSKEIVKVADLSSQGKALTPQLKKKIISVIDNAGMNRRDVLFSHIESGEFTDAQVAQMMAERYKLEIVDLNVFEIDPKTLKACPKKVCEKYKIIPIMNVEGTVIIACVDPGNIEMKETVSILTNSKYELVVAELKEVKKLIKVHHNIETSKKMKNIFSFVETQDVSDRAKENISQQSESKIIHDPIVQTVSHLINDGISRKCSDIHVEVYDKKCRVRYRVDGHLGEYLEPPIAIADGITSRIKVLCNLNISERRLPQDGRLKFKTNNGDFVSFRVSTVPVVNGEKVVMRVLDSSALGAEITDLGMDEGQLHSFQEYLNRSQGLILMTGPTGSGKTTTIYSGLQQLNKPHRNISTAEDPVEYRIPGINQVQVNADIGLTFASVLRSFLRQDPDVILVGEIRDLETASIAYRAAATGHLVVSTLHTNDSVSTVTRLVDIGIPTYSVAENTSLVIAQRLLRVLCNQCKEPVKVSTKQLLDIGFTEDRIELVKDKIMGTQGGCQSCNFSGYKGRIAVFEVLQMSSDLKKGILAGDSPKHLKERALKEGELKTLRMSALDKLAQGITTMNEVLYGTIGDN